MKEIGYIRRIPLMYYNKKIAYIPSSVPPYVCGSTGITGSCLDIFYEIRKEIFWAITSCNLFLAISFRIFFRANFLRKNIHLSTFLTAWIKGKSKKKKYDIHHDQKQSAMKRKFYVLLLLAILEHSTIFYMFKSANEI